MAIFVDEVSLVPLLGSFGRMVTLRPAEAEFERVSQFIICASLGTTMAIRFLRKSLTKLGTNIVPKKNDFSK